VQVLSLSLSLSLSLYNIYTCPQDGGAAERESLERELGERARREMLASHALKEAGLYKGCIKAPSKRYYGAIQALVRHC
jgi:hypothetical protein